MHTNEIITLASLAMRAVDSEESIIGVVPRFTKSIVYVDDQQRNHVEETRTKRRGVEMESAKTKPMESLRTD